MKLQCIGFLLCILIPGLSYSREIANTQSGYVSSDSAGIDFNDYQVDIFDETITLPQEYQKDFDGVWRDSFGKRMDEPRVNFAGRYLLSLHSCGTDCRYYALTDLVSGQSNQSVAIFASADPPPLTEEGYSYTTQLLYRMNSAMLVAQYWIKAPDGELCREQIFLFDGERLKAITDIRDHCGTWDE